MPTETIDYENYVSDTREIIARAQEEGTVEQYEKDLAGATIGASFGSVVRDVAGWTKRLPRNFGIGVFRTVLNTIETADDIFQAGAEFAVGSFSGDDGIEPVKPLKTLFPGMFEAAHNFIEEAEAQNTVADDITQGAIQFIVPFAGYLKAMGGLKNISALARIGKLALAEGITSASAFEAHEGRMADLFEMGRQMENRFGEFLGKISPDDSLVNTYIEWMTNKENESELGGRYKNAVDSLVVTGAFAAVLKVMGRSLKTARKVLSAPEKLQIPPNARLQLELQESAALQPQLKESLKTPVSVQPQQPQLKKSLKAAEKGAVVPKKPEILPTRVAKEGEPEGLGLPAQLTSKRK